MKVTCKMPCQSKVGNVTKLRVNGKIAQRTRTGYKPNYIACLPLQLHKLQCSSQNSTSHQVQNPQHHHRLLAFSASRAPVLLLIPALLSASNLSIPSLVACNTLSCLSHMANGRLGCAMNSSAPNAFPDGECTIPPLDSFSEING